MLFRFRKFPVYKLARKFRKEVYQLTKKFPSSESYVLKSQIQRAALSICLNIAEGSNRRSDTDFARFLNISFASLDEVGACLDAALDEEYISEKEYNLMNNSAEELAKQLLGFHKSLLK